MGKQNVCLNLSTETICDSDTFKFVSFVVLLDYFFFSFFLAGFDKINLTESINISKI